ncbi:IS4 family transposase [Geminisphaera colitermitum]|uniref:IS4 family transposase n=3 Tax=Geminisphaera colitermitum TaxID=1148786 RepID=UPI000158D0AF|nr:IS4 family transposase [Geminisphaera colitermitum]
MKKTWMTEEWGLVKGLLPEGWEVAAREQGAFKQAKGIRTAEELLRLILMHAGSGLSLRHAVARGAAAGLPEVSDVALLKRLRNAEGWLRWMSVRLLEQQAGQPRWSRLPEGWTAVAVDSTTIEESGASGTDWRLHYAIGLPSLFCEQAELTDNKGGESLCRYKVRKGDLFLGDRNFCRAPQIRHVMDHQGAVLLRWHSTSLPLFDQQGHALDVPAWLAQLRSRQCSGLPVFLKDGTALRLCALRVSPQAAQRERAKIRLSAKKNGRKPSCQCLCMADYIVVVTSLPSSCLDSRGILQLYRLRWQIELAFKRLKSLLNTGHVPKKDPLSSRSWLQAKLLTCLLIEKSLLQSEVFSPWGFILPD